MLSPPRVQCFVKQANPRSRRLAGTLLEAARSMSPVQLTDAQEALRLGPSRSLDSLKLIHNRKGTDIRPEDGIVQYLKAMAKGDAHVADPDFEFNTYYTIADKLGSALGKDLNSSRWAYAASRAKPATDIELIPRFDGELEAASAILNNITKNSIGKSRIASMYGVPEEALSGTVRQVSARPFGKLLFTPHIADPTYNLAFEAGKNGTGMPGLPPFARAAYNAASSKSAEEAFLSQNKNFRIVDADHYPSTYKGNTTTQGGLRDQDPFYETVLPGNAVGKVDKNTQNVFVLSKVKPTSGRSVATIGDIARRVSGNPIIYKGSGGHHVSGMSRLKDSGHTGWWFTPNIHTASNYAGVGPEETAFALPVPKRLVEESEKRRERATLSLFNYISKRNGYGSV